MTPRENYTGAADAKFMLAMQFGAASKYTDDLSDAIKRGNRRVLQQGKIPGRPPLGYLKTHEHERVPGSGTVIPDPERFEFVKRVWKACLAKPSSLAEVWRQARYDWGLTTRPTPKVLAHPVSLTTMYNLLRNPFYAGKLMHDGKFLKGEHPAMVTWRSSKRSRAS